MRRGLGFHNRRSPGVAIFSPSSLFAGGVNGAWYDPSDSTTLFSDRAGTTPCAAPGAGALVPVGRMLDKSGNANHATAANDTTARPELSARVNLLTYSEQFENAAWSKNSVTATANVAVSPDGTTTADKIIPTAANVTHSTYNASAVAIAIGAVYTASVYVKAAEYNFVAIVNNTIASYNASVCIDLTTGAQSNAGASGTYTVTSVGNGWWRVTATATATSTNGYLEVHPRATAGPANSGFLGDGTSGVLLWGADLRPTNIGTTIPAYQRVADQYTYDTVGFPRYLAFNGTSSAMSTPANVNLSGTDKATVFAGVRKLATTSAGGAIAEFSTTWFSNNGTFVLYAPDGTSQNFGWGSRGTVGTSYVAPLAATQTSYVATGVGNISGDVTQLRLNGAVAATDTADQGTGNYGTYPLFIGARNTSSLWFNGYIYGLTVVGSALTASQISSMEQWQAGKEGITI